MFTVYYADHTDYASEGSFSVESISQARKLAQIFGQSGYRDVWIVDADKVGVA